jgi:hypothetical protein
VGEAPSAISTTENRPDFVMRRATAELVTDWTDAEETEEEESCGGDSGNCRADGVGETRDSPPEAIRLGDGLRVLPRLESSSSLSSGVGSWSRGLASTLCTVPVVDPENPVPVSSRILDSAAEAAVATWPCEISGWVMLPSGVWLT